MPKLVMLTIAIISEVALFGGVGAEGKCIDQPGLNNDMSACAALQERASNEILNRAYDALACRLDAEGNRRLKASQQAWEMYRNSTCYLKARTSLLSGAFHAPVTQKESYCRADLAEKRARELFIWLPKASHAALVPCGK